MLSRKNLNFLNVRNTGFWHSGRQFALLQMPSLENLKAYLRTPSKPNFFFLLIHPLKPIFSCSPLKSRQPPPPPTTHLIKKMNGPLVAVSSLL